MSKMATLPDLANRINAEHEAARGAFKKGEVMTTSTRGSITTLMAALTLGVVAGPPHAAPTYTVIDLGDLPSELDQSGANAINECGQVAGWSYAATGARGFLWDGSVMTDLGDLPGGLDASGSIGINSSGQVVGSSNAATAERAKANADYIN